MRTISARAIYNDLNYSNWTQGKKATDRPPWAVNNNSKISDGGRMTKRYLKKRVTLAKVSIQSKD